MSVGENNGRSVLDGRCPGLCRYAFKVELEDKRHGYGQRIESTMIFTAGGLQVAACNPPAVYQHLPATYARDSGSTRQCIVHLQLMLLSVSRADAVPTYNSCSSRASGQMQCPPATHAFPGQPGKCSVQSSQSRARFRRTAVSAAFPQASRVGICTGSSVVTQNLGWWGCGLERRDLSKPNRPA